MTADQFILERDAAIKVSAEHLEWQPFYEFCINNDIVIPIACPREKMALVIFCQFLAAKRNGVVTESMIILPGKTLSAEQYREILRGRGFQISADETYLINKIENDRKVVVPDCLRIWEGDGDGLSSSGNGEVGASLDSAGNNPDSAVSGNQGGTRVIRNERTSVPLRRGNGQTKRPNQLP